MTHRLGLLPESVTDALDLGPVPDLPRAPGPLPGETPPPPCAPWPSSPSSPPPPGVSHSPPSLSSDPPFPRERRHTGRRRGVQTDWRSSDPRRRSATLPRGSGNADVRQHPAVASQGAPAVGSPPVPDASNAFGAIGGLAGVASGTRAPPATGQTPRGTTHVAPQRRCPPIRIGLSPLSTQQLQLCHCNA